MKYVRTLFVAVLSLLSANVAVAQWQVPQNAVPIGRGSGVTGFANVLSTAPGLPFVGQGSSALPSFQVLGYAGGGTNATTQTGARNNIFPAATRNGDIIRWNGTAWVAGTPQLPGGFLSFSASQTTYWAGTGGVRPEQYGALRNSATNDTVAIAAAAAAANINGLGIELSDGGAYSITPIQFGGPVLTSGTAPGSVTGTVLTLTRTPSMPFAPGQTISGTGITAGTKIVSYGTRTNGWIGTYNLDTASAATGAITVTATVPQYTATITGTSMVVSAVAGGKLLAPDAVVGPGVTSGTTIVSQSSGSAGGAGTYVLSTSNTVAAPTALQTYPMTIVPLPRYIRGASSGSQFTTVLRAFGVATTPAPLVRLVVSSSLGVGLGFEFGNLRMSGTINGNVLQTHGFSASSAGGIPVLHDVDLVGGTGDTCAFSAVGNAPGGTAAYGMFEFEIRNVTVTGATVCDSSWNGNDGDGSYNIQSGIVSNFKNNSAGTGVGAWWNFANVTAPSFLVQNHAGNTMDIDNSKSLQFSGFYSEANGGTVTGTANSAGVDLTGSSNDGLNATLLACPTCRIKYRNAAGTFFTNDGAVNATSVTSSSLVGVGTRCVQTDAGGVISASGVSCGGGTPAALTKADDTNVTLTLTGTPATALLQAVQIAAGWNGQLGLTRGGTNASLTASNGGIFYSTATAGAVLAGTATAQQMLQSGASAAPAWSTATWPATTTANQLLYSSSANTVAGLTSAASSVLLTNGSSIPAWTAMGAGVGTALGVNVNTAGGFVTYTGTFNGTLTSSVTGFPYATGGTGVLPRANGGTGVATGTGMYAISATGVNFNAVGDTALPIVLPTGFTRFIPFSLLISNASATTTTVVYSLFTTTGGGGTALIAGTTSTVSTAADATANNAMRAATNAISAVVASLPNTPNVYFRVATPQGSAVTADVTLVYFAVP